LINGVYDGLLIFAFNGMLDFPIVKKHKRRHACDWHKIKVIHVNFEKFKTMLCNIWVIGKFFQERRDLFARFTPGGKKINYN